MERVLATKHPYSTNIIRDPTWPKLTRSFWKSNIHLVLNLKVTNGTFYVITRRSFP